MHPCAAAGHMHSCAPPWHTHQVARIHEPLDGTLLCAPQRAPLPRIQPGHRVSLGGRAGTTRRPCRGHARAQLCVRACSVVGVCAQSCEGVHERVLCSGGGCGRVGEGSGGHGAVVAGLGASVAQRWRELAHSSGCTAEARLGTREGQEPPWKHVQRRGEAHEAQIPWPPQPRSIPWLSEVPQEHERGCGHPSWSAPAHLRARACMGVSECTHTHTLYVCVCMHAHAHSTVPQAALRGRACVPLMGCA